MPDEDWRDVIETNLSSVFYTCRAVTRGMMKKRAGSIVNVSSIVGVHGNWGQTNYGASKAGIIGFTKSLAREGARHKITVNCVCPGPTDTPLFAEIGGDNPKLREALIRAIPMRRLAQPTDLANVVAFLASDEAAYVTGQTVSVSGGLTMS
jgi:2-hydroxycyclohexanecarboxyl-CoA dehydrogenase